MLGQHLVLAWWLLSIALLCSRPTTGAVQDGGASRPPNAGVCFSRAAALGDHAPGGPTAPRWNCQGTAAAAHERPLTAADVSVAHPGVIRGSLGSRGSSTSSYSIFPQTAFGCGVGINSQPGLRLSDCTSLCDATSSCHLALWDAHQQHCFLRMLPLAEYTMAPLSMANMTAAVQAPGGYSILPAGMTFDGCAGIPIAASSLAACTQMCDRVSRCIAVSHWPHRCSCLLHQARPSHTLQLAIKTRGLQLLAAAAADS